MFTTRRDFLLATAAAPLATQLPLSFARADETPSFVLGEIVGAHRERAVQLLGHAGVLVIRSAAHLNWVLEGLYAAGYPIPKGKPPFGADFGKEVIAVVLHDGEDDHIFQVRQVAADETNAKVDVAMGYQPLKHRRRAIRTFYFVAIQVPRRPNVDLFISTYPYEIGKEGVIDGAKREWSHDFTADRGDLVDGLHARLIPAKLKITRGEDIELGFELAFHSPVKEHGQFSLMAKSAYVWDGKYSFGFRNHAFLVESPDGTSKLLRPADKDFDKNSPHPVHVEAGKPYRLPEWDANPFKSLQQLGLKTEQPGRYTITGLYAEDAMEAHMVKRLEPPMWGGRIATAPIVVEVT